MVSSLVAENGTDVCAVRRISLRDMVYAYNHAVRRSLRLRLSDVEGEEAATKAWINLYYKDSCKSHTKRTTLEEGQRARISHRKGEFEEGYVPNWHVNISSLISAWSIHAVYKLKDALDEPVKGNFYAEEVQGIPRVTLQAERVVRRRKRGQVNEVLVKWRGSSDKFNRWIPSADLPKYKRRRQKKLKMSTPNAFTVTCPSNSNMDKYPKNVGSDYTVALANPLNFSDNHK